jgi:multidrug efflux system outer membrane protein
MHKSILAIAITAVALSGCSLIPEYRQPASPVAALYPHELSDTSSQAGESAAAGEQGWRNVFRDSALQQLIQVSLTNNRDLRVAALNIESYRAQYRIQRADLFPAVAANASGTRERLPADLSSTGRAGISSSYSANLGISAYELDFFGRVRSLNKEALETYLASEEARRSTHIALVASVANAYYAWQADKELLQLTQDTLGAYEQSLKLTARSTEVGITSALDLAQARTSVESARVSLATYQRTVAQDRDALVLLLGTELPEDLPASLPLDSKQITEVPPGITSDLLRRRPDILEAEHTLIASNANIGAARAAFFPSISLTASAGSSSAQLGDLFKGGQGSWSFAPSLSLPIFNAGSLRASLDYSKIQKDINVANYEKAIQTAFQEVSDGLAARKTYRDQLQAQQDSVKANQNYYHLAELRYRAGTDSNLTFLDAQRSLFSSQQSVITDRLAQLTSEVNLFKALGGGWIESSAAQRSAQVHNEG